MGGRRSKGEDNLELGRLQPYALEANLQLVEGNRLVAIEICSIGVVGQCKVCCTDW